jgi:acetoin utilization protein AcuB
MLVKYWMSKNVITINADKSIKDAMDLLEEHNIHMLPVMEEENLIGVVTDHDMKRAKTAAAATMERHDHQAVLEKLKVRTVMTKDIISVHRNMSIEETAEILLEKNISSVPVIDKDGELAGVITKSDIFRVIISLTGLKRRGIQFALKVEDKPGSIWQIADIIRKYGGRMACILTSYERVAEGYRRVYIRMYNIDRFKLQSLKEELMRNATLLYLIDLKEASREIY